MREIRRGGRRAAGLAGAALVAVLASGCMTFELEGDGALTPDSEHGSATVHGSLWGFAWSHRDVEVCEGAGIYRAEFHTNAAFLAVAVLSLGLYVPQTVEWWCDEVAPDDDGDADDGDDDGDDVWDPDADDGEPDAPG